MSTDLVIHVDGACRGNPGPAGIGVVISQDGKVIKEISRAIGNATNNIAEYSALICALNEAIGLKAKKILVFTDSELVFKQVTGVYKIKNETIKVLSSQVRSLIKNFSHFEIKHVLREYNKDADRLASGILDKGQAEVVALLFDNSKEESPSSKG